MNKKKKDPGFPYDATPEVHHFPGNADSCFDMVNQYGTYEIQATADTRNQYPCIAQGYNPKIKKRDGENSHDGGKWETDK